MDEFGALFCNASMFYSAAYHKTCNILKENERDSALATELDKVGAFLRAFTKEDAIVGEYTDMMAHDGGKAADECLAIEGLEFVKLTSVEETRKYGIDRKCFFRICRDQVEQLFWVIEGGISVVLKQLWCRDVPKETSYKNEGVMVIFS